MNTRMIMRLLALALMLALMVPVVAVAESTDSTKEPAVTSLKLGVQEKYQIDGSSIPGAEGKTLKYVSSNKKTATVSAGGMITGKKKGSVSIYVGYDKTVLAIINVKVMKAPKKVTLADKKLLISKGESQQLTVSLPKNTSSSITFSSSDPSVATVDALGKVEALASGKAVITAATYNKKTAKCTVYVMDGAAPTSMTLNTESVSLAVKETFEIKPTLNEGSDTIFSYSSKNKKIATVSSGGVITGKKKGTTTVTVKTHNGLTKTVKVTVKGKLTNVYGCLTSDSKTFLKYAKKLKLKKDNDPEFEGVMYYDSQVALIFMKDKCQVDLNPAKKPKYSMDGIDVGMTYEEATAKLIAKGWKLGGTTTVDGVEIRSFAKEGDTTHGIAISSDDGTAIGGIVAVLNF